MVENRKKIIQIFREKEAEFLSENKIRTLLHGKTNMRKVLDGLLIDKIISINSDGMYQITNFGKHIAEELNSGEKFIQHKWKYGTKCLVCGLNRQGCNKYWFDGKENEILKNPPQCIRQETT